MIYALTDFLVCSRFSCLVVAPLIFLFFELFLFNSTVLTSLQIITYICSSFLDLNLSRHLKKIY